MSQIAFDWPRHISYAPEDFVVSDSNAKAKIFIDAWQPGSEKAALIYGPSACGKTHLIHCFSARTGAIIIDKEQLGKVPSDQILQNHIPAVLEDIEVIKNETALFSLLRHAEIQGIFLLLTSRMAARQHEFILPDVRSRLLSVPAFAIDPPDEKILHIYIAKCFSDRQLQVSEEVIEYITKRTERSFVAVQNVVDGIERKSMEAKKDITVPFVKTLFFN